MQHVGSFIKRANSDPSGPPTRERGLIPGHIAGLEATVNGLPLPASTPARFVPAPRTKKTKPAKAGAGASSSSPAKKDPNKKDPKKEDEDGGDDVDPASPADPSTPPKPAADESNPAKEASASPVESPRYDIHGVLQPTAAETRDLMRRWDEATAVAPRPAGFTAINRQPKSPAKKRKASNDAEDDSSRPKIKLAKKKKSASPTQPDEAAETSPAPEGPSDSQAERSPSPERHRAANAEEYEAALFADMESENPGNNPRLNMAPPTYVMGRSAITGRREWAPPGSMSAKRFERSQMDK